MDTYFNKSILNILDAKQPCVNQVIYFNCIDLGYWNFNHCVFQSGLKWNRFRPNNKDKLFLQNSNNSHSTTVSATQIYFSNGNITNETIIESGINGTKVQVSYEGIGQFTG